MFGEIIQHKKLPKRPNRISRVDDTHVAIIYENDVDILILETGSFTQSVIKPPLKEGEVIKGITALSSTEIFIATNGGKDNPRIMKLIQNEGKIKILNSIDKVTEKNVFEMPRRITATPDKSKIIVADENDRRIILLDREGNIINAQEKWNERLYNVRGMAASNEAVFIAACNGITTANFKNLEVHNIPLIKFPSDVYHTRAVALDQNGKYLVISQAIDDSEIVRVFVMPKSADMFCTEPKVISSQLRGQKSKFIFACLFRLLDYLE